VRRALSVNSMRKIALRAKCKDAVEPVHGGYLKVSAGDVLSILAIFGRDDIADYCGWAWAKDSRGEVGWIHQTHLTPLCENVQLSRLYGYKHYLGFPRAFIFQDGQVFCNFHVVLPPPKTEQVLQVDLSLCSLDHGNFMPRDIVVEKVEDGFLPERSRGGCVTRFVDCHGVSKSYLDCRYLDRRCQTQGHSGFCPCILDEYMSSPHRLEDLLDFMEMVRYFTDTIGFVCNHATHRSVAAAVIVMCLTGIQSSCPRLKHLKDRCQDQACLAVDSERLEHLVAKKVMKRWLLPTAASSHDSLALGSTLDTSPVHANPFQNRRDDQQRLRCGKHCPKGFPGCTDICNRRTPNHTNCSCHSCHRYSTYGRWR
jgi:hypothetical protein